MAVDRFQRWFGSVHYDWCTGTTSIPPVDWASPQARMFIWPEGQPHPSFKRSDSEELNRRLAEDAETRAAWQELDPDVRSEILALATVAPHEDTHRVDMLTTPLGAAVAVGCVFGYLGLEKLAPELADAGDDVLGEPLIRLEVVRQDLVKRLVLPLSFKRRGAYVEQGWPNGIDQVPMWGRSYRTVTVIGQFETLQTIPNPPSYVTLTTILEARGVAHALRRVCWLFGSEPRVAGQAMADYLQSFYADQLQWHDYRFLFDMIAHATGQESFEQLLQEAAERNDARLIEQFAILLSTLCWAALHGTDPVVRLWVANVFAEQHLSGRRSGPPVWQDMGELLAEYDRWQVGGGGPGVHDVLHGSLKYVSAGRAAAAEIADPEAREHFLKLMDTLAFQLRRRLDSGSGFVTAMGLTHDGEPLHHGVDMEEAVNLVTLCTGAELDALLTDTTRPIEPPEPPPSLARWFEQLPFLLLHREDKVERRREWLTEHYRIAHVMCPRCLTLIPVSQWLRRQRVSCPACGHGHDVDLDEATVL